MQVLTASKLRRLLDDIGRIRKLDDWCPNERWYAPNVYPAEVRAKRTIYVTKLAGLMGIAFYKLPAYVTLLSRYGVPSRAFCDRIALECTSKTLEFIGDLDPLDLTVYAALASQLAKHEIRVRYCGVNSDWLAWCNQNLRRKRRLPTITMDRAQRRHFALLKDTGLPWERIIGASAVALLESGEKLELEGATNPAFYRGRTVTRAIEKRVLGLR